MVPFFGWISTMKQKAEYQRRLRVYGQEGVEGLPKPQEIVPIDFVLNNRTRSVIITGKALALAF